MFQIVGTFLFDGTFVGIALRDRDRIAATFRMTLSKELPMGGIIYLVGLIVIVLFILSLFGLR